MDEIISLFFAIGRQMREGAQASASGVSCSLLHFHTLHYIKEHEKPLMHDVARHLLVTPPAATLLIEGLVKQKLIKRIVDKRDRRAVRLALTPQGKALLAHGIRAKTARFKKIFSVLSARERAGLVRVLKKVVSHLS